MKRHRSMPWLVSALRAAVLAVAAGLLSWNLTVGSGVVAAVAGALAGALAADLASRGRLRLPSALLLALVALAVGSWGAWLVATSPLFAGLLGPLPAIRLSEALRWLALAAPIAFALRFAAARRPTLAVLEVWMVAMAVVHGLSSHRDGMVHRPFAVGDWAWTRGYDPAKIFLVLGGLATLLLAALLLSEERRKRIPLHFVALAVVALALFTIVQVGGLPKPRPAGDLGLTGEPDDEEGEGAEQRSSGEGDADQLGDLQFKDEYGSAGGEAPVAVVLLHDDYSPPSGVYYFRQSVFSQFNGRRLVQATRDDVDRDVMRRFPFERTEIPSAPPVSEVRAPLSTSMGLLVDHVHPFALDSPAAIQPIRNPDPLRFQRAFQVLSHVQTLPYDQMIGQRPGKPEWDSEQWEHFTEAPRDPRYAETAERLVDRLLPAYRGDPLAQALAIKTYLDKNGIYSRKSRHAGSGDPAGSFLFGDLTGYCVHFAHAATYLYRSRGIPARVAAGYAVEEASRGGGSAIMIRGINAHAWPEIYLEDVGWVVVDLSPETSLDEPNTTADSGLQRMLGEMMRQQQGEDPGFEDQRRDPVTLADLLAFLRRLLLLLAGVAYAVKLYRWWAPRLAPSRQLYRVAYRAALDRLAEVGLWRRYGESRERFAHRAQALSPAFGALTEEHLRSALGSPHRQDAGGAMAAMRGVALDLRRAVPAWRRIAGAINPVSWMFAR